MRANQPDIAQYVDTIEGKVLDTLRSMNEYNELDYLQKIYDAQIKGLDSEAVEEYKMLCGENGYSVLKRLNLPQGSTIQAMEDKARQGAVSANKKAYIYSRVSPQNSDLYCMLEHSYNLLIERICDMAKRKENAERELIIAKSFFEGE